MTVLPLVWGALEVLAGSDARAAAGPCASASIVVEADPATLGRWPELPERVRAAFAERRDIDTCARVHVGLVGGTIDLEVSLPDGRSTSRLARLEDVVPALEALLLVPTEAAPATPATPPPSAASTRFASTVVEVRTDGSGPATTSPGAPPSRFGAELSLGAGVHRGGGQTSASLGASSFLEAARWLVGFTARLDRYDGAAAGASGDAPAALEIGALVGRRFRFGPLMLDAAAGPALALRGSWAIMMATSASSGMVTPVRSSSSRDEVVPRWLLGGRLTLGARSIVRTFVGVDGELGDAGPIPPGTARALPVWTVGATFGVTVGTL
jgi:hypothetical protein